MVTAANEPGHVLLLRLSAGDGRAGEAPSWERFAVCWSRLAAALGWRNARRRPRYGGPYRHRWDRPCLAHPYPATPSRRTHQAQIQRASLSAGWDLARMLGRAFIKSAHAHQLGRHKITFR